MRALTDPAAPDPSRLRRRILAVLLLASLLPLVLMGSGAWVVFGRMLEARAVALQRTVVRSHAASIEAYLATRRDLLVLLASTVSRDEITEEQTLRRLFEALNQTSERGFVDLGVIDAEGRHLAYVGPYDLSDRNYSGADWFREVMVRGVFISDVFLGFRQVPHFVIAVRQDDRGRPWILRATINSDTFDALVRTGALGTSGEAFLVSHQGLYQTAPRLGSVLDRAPLPTLTEHSGVRDQRLEIAGVDRIVVTTWIANPRWLLVVQQDAAEVRAPVTRAMAVGALLISLAMLLVVATTLFATRHLSRQIDRANRQREEMFGAFMRSAKLASVGELATGLAHEINNPLAIISAEQTNIGDLVDLLEDDCSPPSRSEIRDSARRIADQVRRCAAITSKMLDFGRRQESSLELTELKPRLEEIAALLERQARVRNVELELELGEPLPRVLIDPLELEQVLVNLITNSFQAMPQGGRITVSARERERAVWLEVADTGQGMSPEVRERVFEPFFTTKAAGQGTGLGLSVCYGLVHSWGGRMEVESEPGQGTVMRIRLPLADAA